MALVVLKKSPGRKNYLKYRQANVGAKTEPPTRKLQSFFQLEYGDFYIFFFL